MGVRIMLIENDIDIAGIVNIILTAEGFEVLESNICQFDKDIVQFEPHLIILDYLLEHGISGADLCANLKSNFNTMHIPVILISALMHLERISIHCEATAYINKPFDLDDFVNKVKDSIPIVA
jgi:DNA-binding response OmpR family regulator